jgi:heavy metal translocating P-type ATPase
MSTGAACGLCELPCGRGALTRAFDKGVIEFCCMGCANVYAILLESGVLGSGQNIRETEVYRRSLELGLISNPDGDMPRARKAAATPIDPNAPTQEALYQIGGMWCSACGWLIEHAVEQLPGIVSVEVFFASDLAKVKYSPLMLPPDRIPARIRDLGYRVTEYGEENTQAKSDLRDLLTRLGVAAFLWANIMAFSVILYVGYFEKISATASRTLPFILWALATPLVFYSAWPILRSAALGLRSMQTRMETLLALGILTAYCLSAAQTLRGQTHVYFDTDAAIVTLVLAGKLIERAAKDRAARSISMLYRVMPKKARVEIESGERFVSIDALEPGTIFIVKAGERIPADGVVVSGSTYTDESLLSGESAPRARAEGDTVVSGSLNAGSVIRVRALRTSEDSALAQIIRLVERALSSRAPIERTVDQISRVFVPAVVVLAVAEFGFLVAMHYGVGPALLRATAILVIACPCALGLATPLAITAAVGAASQAGMLIADSRVLETMSKIDTVVLDKTGTITYGDFRLLEFALFSVGSNGEAFLTDYLPLLAGVEAYSEHLLGRAVVQYARDHGVRPAAIGTVEIRKGQGIVAAEDGRTMFIGNRALAEAENCEVSADAEATIDQWQRQGRTVTLFGIGGTLRGALGFGDQLKPDARAMVERLVSRGIRVKLVSGDAWPTTDWTARQIGITDFTAEATPDGKAKIIKELQAAGHRVAILGDGVNDAPALAQADLGIALGTGADIAMSAAPVVLVSGALAKVDEAFRLAARTSRIVRQNLFWAFFYNIAGISLAIAGVLTPIYAAAAMFLSSVSVVANSMRLSQRSNGGV